MRGVARSGMRAGTKAGTRVGKDARTGRRPVPGAADVSTTPRRWARAPGRSRQRSFAAARAERPRPPSAERPRRRARSVSARQVPSPVTLAPAGWATFAEESRAETPREKEKARTTTAATVAGAAYAEAASAEATLRATYEDAARAHAFSTMSSILRDFFRAVEAYLVDAASERLASEGEEEASALFAFARI